MKRGLVDMPHLLERLGSPLLVGGKGGGLMGARGKLDMLLAGLSDRLRLAPVVAMPMPSDDDQDEEDDREQDLTSDGIAVIPVIGSLVHRKGGMEALCGMTSYAELAEDLDEALADGNVKGILLELDSPGGEVAGCFELADKIRQASAVKPVHAFANGMACSAAFALACAAESITVTPTADVGSVGVVWMHLDQSAADQKDGLKFTYIYAGDRKVDGNSHAPLSPRAHATMQADIDTVYDLFVKRVAEDRRMSQTAVKNTEAGTFMGGAAVAADFADQVGTLDDALAAVRADVARRKAKMSLSKIATKLQLPEDATEEAVLAALDASAKGHAEALAARAAAEKGLAQSEAASELLAGKVSELEGKLASKDADHAIELAKTRLLEAGLSPMAKDVEDDARDLFTAGKVDLAKRTLERHLEASRAKVGALRDPKVRALADEEPKSPKSKASVLEKARADAAKLVESGGKKANKGGQAAK